MIDARSLFGVELPIIQAPMAGVQGSELAIEVSTAGALGSLPCAMLTADQIDADLRALKAATSSPFNINFFCHQHRSYDEVQADKWHTTLSEYFKYYQLAPERAFAGSGRHPFSHEVADIIEPYLPFVLSFHFGLPAADLLRRVKSWGVPVISSATTVLEAQWLQSKGVNAIIAQGLEAGGHRGMFMTDDLSTQVGTVALLPQIINAVDIPVIAAGGISTATGVQAALAMGAVAVQAGTAFLLCNEAKTSEVHRRYILSDASQHTAITNVFSGKPARSIVNKAVREIGPISEHVMDFPHAAVAMAALRSSAEKMGSGDFSPLWCGQNPAGCDEVAAQAQVHALSELL